MNAKTEWNICRICLQEGEMVSIFDETSDNSENVTLSEKIMYCTPIKVDRKRNLPEQICFKCLNDLEIAYKLRVTSENSEDILRTIIESATIEHEMELDSELTIEEDKGDLLIFNEPTGQYYKMEDPLTLIDTNYSVEFTEEEETKPQIDAINVKRTVPIKLTTIKQVKTNKTRLGRGKKTQDGIKPLKYCVICGNSYKFQHSLDGHMRRHRNEKPFKCDICSKSFVIKFELNRHMRIHSGQKPYACKYCDRCFADFGSRVKHERIHTGEKPYECDKCGRRFALSYVLASHYLIHTGEKKFKCEICDKRFTKSHHLKAHRLVHERKQQREKLAADNKLATKVSSTNTTNKIKIEPEIIFELIDTQLDDNANDKSISYINDVNQLIIEM